MILSLDDLEDAIERCQHTALCFPEQGAHEEIAALSTKGAAEQLCFTVSAYTNDREQVSVFYKERLVGWMVYVVYNLSPEELQEALEALEDHLVWFSWPNQFFTSTLSVVKPEDIPPMDPTNPADRELDDVARKIIEELNRMEEENND